MVTGRGHKEKDTDLPIHYMIEGKTKVIYKKDGSSWEAFDVDADLNDREDISSELSKDIKDKLNIFINRNN